MRRPGRIGTARLGRTLVAAAIIAAVALPWLVEPYTLHTVARLLAIGLLAVSVAVLAGHAGLPSLGQVAPYAIGAYTTGVLAKAGHHSAALQLLVATVLAGAFCALVGLAVVRTRGTVFLMVTLAVGQLTVTGIEQSRGLSGGTDGLAGIPAATLGPFSLAPPRAAFWYAAVVTGLAVAAAWWLLHRHPAGLLLRGVRDHETRMRSSGHRVSGVLLVTYVAAGVLAAVAGSLLVTVQRYVSPADVGFHLSALVLLAVVIGGAHSLAGAVLATAVVMFVRDQAAVVAPGHGPLLLGALFIAAVYLLPAGLAGAWRELTRRRGAHPPGERV